MAELAMRPMRGDDLAAVERIFRSHLPPPPGRRARPALRPRVAELLASPAKAVALVAADAADRTRGFLVGEVRSWEFGSAPTGWIFAVGVDPEVARQGVGRRLLDAAVAAFAALGVATVRTMVRRDDIPVLRFFRGGHFVAGPYVELEIDLGPAREEEP